MNGNRQVAVHGAVAPGYETVADIFAQTLKGEPGRGGALAIRVEGRVVVDLWGGESRIGRKWEPDTPTVIFSCTKGLLAILVGELVGQGRLDLDAPVARYWPEFAAAGKDAIPVRWLLSHRAGLPALRDDIPLDVALDWDQITARLAAEAPILQPGGPHLYHALTYGWLVGEVIRRVTGESVGRRLARQLSEPLGVDAWIGVPRAHLDRVAQLFSSPAVLSFPPLGDSELVPVAMRAMTLGAAFPEAIAHPNAGFNDDRVRQAEVPGAGGVASARALAKIWSATVTPEDGVSVLDAAVIAEMTRVQSSGIPALPFPPPWPTWGTGFQLDSLVRPLLTSRSFGHDGAGGQVAFADPDYRVGFGYVTNDLRMGEDQRGVDLVHALQKALRITTDGGKE